jgi:acetate kinase
MPDAKALLTLNAGSSSLKASLFEVRDGAISLALKGQVEGIGVAPRFTTRTADGALGEETAWPDPLTPFETLLQAVIDWAEAHLGAAALMAVGHRVVHGGREHVSPERVTPALIAALERLIPLAPLHEPHNLAPMRAIAASRPDLPQAACFDTAFHATLPDVAARFALPEAFWDAGVRRYGFHGLSYEYIARRLAVVAPDLAAGRVVVAHLGSGASLCALRAGVSIDTTMGFTALDGLMMATRCGAIDPGVILYLLRQDDLSPEAVETLLYQRSGLLGVSGLTGDMSALLASDDPHAAEAVELFVYLLVRQAGGLICTLGGLDGLVFTAGIGERAAAIRARVCERLAWLGVTLDPVANAANAELISTPASRVCVRVIPTDEELMIARHTLDVTERP